MDKKIQHLDFAFRSQNEIIQTEIEIDTKFNFIEKIIINGEFFPSPAAIENFNIDNDSSLFEKGTWVSHFQNLIEQNGLTIDYKLNTQRAKVSVTLKDITTGVFAAYNLQIALILKKV